MLFLNYNYLYFIKNILNIYILLNLLFYYNLINIIYKLIN